MNSPFAQPKQLLIFVSNESIARIDIILGKKTTVTAAHSAQRPEFSELAAAVEQAIALGDRQRGQVFVFAEQLWSGRVVLPLEVVNAVKPEQLAQTLALEAEYDSGISPFTALTAHLAIHEASPTQSKAERSWWVTQLDQSQYESIFEAIPKWAGCLAGLAALKPAADKVEPGNGSPTETWLNLGGPLHELSDSVLGEFATHWYELASARPEAIPVIRPVQRGFDGQRQRQLGMVGAALAVLLCVSHFVVARQQQTRLTASITEMTSQEQQLRKQVEQLERALRTTEGESKQQRAQREADAQRIAESRRRQAEHDAARRFPSILLQALSATADPEHHLAKIELAANRVTLTGLALNGQAVAKLAQELDQQLASVAWRVQPPEMNSSGLGPLVSFQLTLVPMASSKTHLTDRRSEGAYVQ